MEPTGETSNLVLADPGPFSREHNMYMETRQRPSQLEKGKKDLPGGQTSIRGTAFLPIALKLVRGPQVPSRHGPASSLTLPTPTLQL